MKEPIRLGADPGAPADLRVDLHRAAKAQAAFDEDAGLARLLVAVAATAGTAAAAKTAAEASAAGAAKATTASGASGASKGLALLLGKGSYWALATIGTASVVAAVSIGRGGDPPAPAAPTAIATAPAPMQPAATLPTEPSAEPAAEVPSAEPSASAHAPPSVASARAPRRLLAEEVKQLAAMRERLGERPADVLAEADRSPSGALAQERAALAIEALVRLGRSDEARARAAAFVARYPTSPLASRMRAIAGG